MKLLLAEDEDAMRMAITDVLAFNQYEVTAVSDGEEALEMAQSNHYDGLLLDIMMPKLDGISVLKTIRKCGDPVPVILLTARCEVKDRVRGLDAGADDYLPKPFAMTELLARIRAMSRRPQLAAQHLSVGNIILDETKGQLICGDASETLSRMEIDLLTYLVRNRGIYFSAESLLDRVWGIDSDAGIGSVWVYISYLRKKLASVGANAEIRSRRGIGYTIEEAEI